MRAPTASRALGDNDTLTGAGGADNFVFDDGDGADTVTDFQNGSDQFDLIGVAGVDDFGDLDLTDNGASVTVDYGTGSFRSPTWRTPASSTRATSCSDAAIAWIDARAASPHIKLAP